MKILGSFNYLVTCTFFALAFVIAFLQNVLPAWFWTNPLSTVLSVAAPLYAYAAIAFARATVLYATRVVERASLKDGYDFTTSLGAPGCAGFMLAVALAFGRPEHATGLPFFAAVVAVGGTGFALFCVGMSLSTPWYERLQKENERFGARP